MKVILYINRITSAGIIIIGQQPPTAFQLFDFLALDHRATPQSAPTITLNETDQHLNNIDFSRRLYHDDSKCAIYLNLLIDMLK